ncbi:mitochondrial coenzyme A diphosphatase NUDT8 [Periplaneta americana]|uniref:mitochondrial coenzyme A diphosphatase NUDT8 n=1 Tax=Periplaneta americana TaxID=6978 RepID=UPI0037E83C9A
MIHSSAFNMIYISRPMLHTHVKEQVMSVRHMKYWFISPKHKISVRHINQDRTISEDFILSKENRENCIAKLRSMKPIRLHDKEPARKAAVLVPLCVVNNELSLLYTLRSSDMKNYRSQVSFPGGIQDKTDANLEETAIRETFEELGIQRYQINIWGHGNFFGTRQKNMAVMPFIGYIGELSLQDLRLNRKEVESVFTVPLKHLIKPDNFKYTQFRSGYVLPVFVGSEYRIWGMTAMITHFVLEALLPAGTYVHKLRYIVPYKTSLATKNKRN